MMTKNLLATLLLALLFVAGSHAFGASTSSFDLDSLPRSTYLGSNGARVSVIRYAEQTWTEVDLAVVLGERQSLYKDVCYEGKFETFIEPVSAKLFGVDGRLVFEDKTRRRQAPELKSLDNVWVCGALQPTKNGRGQELLIFELIKLPPDAQRFENKFNLLETSRNVQGLLELGEKIELSIKNNKNTTMGTMSSFDRMTQLRDKAWALAISIKEKELRPGDANGCYEIAVMYRDRTHRTPQFRIWLMKTLEIDPDHGNASKDAQQILNLVRVGDKWMSKPDAAALQKEMDDSTKELAEKAKEEEVKRTARRKKEIGERTIRLLTYQSALRTSDPIAREGALTTLGEEVHNSLDLGFGLAAVDILTNMSDAAAILPGLEKAAKSEFGEVRQLVYCSLTWRGSQNDVNSQIAYDVLASALKIEPNKEPAQAAANALALAGGKGAIGTLIAGLESNDPGVCEAMIDGLKRVTHRSIQKKDEWFTWWHDNKSSLAANNVESAGIK